MPPTPTRTARSPAARPERFTASNGVDAASETTLSSQSSCLASAGPGTGHTKSAGTTTCDAKPPCRSFPGITCRRHIVRCPARQHGRHHDGTPDERRVHSISDRSHDAADFMAQDERQRATRLHPVIQEREVGVAHPTARHLDRHFTRLWRARRQVAPLERRSRRGHHPRLPHSVRFRRHRQWLGWIFSSAAGSLPKTKLPQAWHSSRERSMPAKQRRSSGESRITLRRKRQSQSSLGAYTASRYSSALARTLRTRTFIDGVRSSSSSDNSLLITANAWIRSYFT